ncbi:MAG: aspartate dehydrogenase [Actinomycetota bacterium]
MTRVAIVGLGAIGRTLVARLAAGVPGLELVAVASRDRAKAEGTLRELSVDVPVKPADELEPLADLVIECAPAHLLPEIAEPFLRAGKEVVVLSAGALLEHPHLIDLAETHGGRISVPTGALLGLDAVGAAAEGEIRSLRLTTRKPAAGLVGAPGIEASGVDLATLTEPVRVFAGTAREAARDFPANLNVAVALSLAGPGPDRTEVEIWADPSVSRNTHTIVMESDVADVTMTIESVPSDNPRTGRITALSVISMLRKREASLRVGS